MIRVRCTPLTLTCFAVSAAFAAKAQLRRCSECGRPLVEEEVAYEGPGYNGRPDPQNLDRYATGERLVLCRLCRKAKSDA